MRPAHATPDFLVTRTGPDLEIWVDWIPAVDGDPKAPVQAHLKGSALVVEPVGEASGRRARRVDGLDPGVLAELSTPGAALVWRVSGPSGVLATHRLSVAKR